jgi:vitamin B12/bleomycin/antimicrobial peptide transport system ATP-binding/permease protein
MALNTADQLPNSGSSIGHDTGFLRRFARGVMPFWSSSHKWMNRARAVALLLVTCAQVGVQVELNFWSARLFNAIEQRAFGPFVAQLYVFAALLAASMAVFGLQILLKRRLQFAWRVWLTKTVLDRWMDRGRHYQLGFLHDEHSNPDGRIAEDIRVVTESAIDLAQSFFYCVLLLGSFITVLWSLSGVLHVVLGGVHVAIPGHLVWIALFYASVGTSMALWVGRPLVSASNLRQTVEADFRFGLVHARENAEGIALIHGDTDERGRLLELLRTVRSGWKQQTAGLTRITLFTSAYSVLASPFPVLVAAPRYIIGLITLGTLMQTAQAFQQVIAALAWPVDNLAGIAQWRASVERVLTLQDSLATLDGFLATSGPGHITYQPSGTTLRFDALRIARPDGSPIMLALTGEIAPGEHVRIHGAPEVSRRLLQVIAGLWPWGDGSVTMPGNVNCHFATDRPYLPIGALAGVICYPASLGACEPAAIEAALRRAGLAELVPLLHDTEDWQQTLSLAQQQRIGFARMLLHRPDWIFFADATDALDDEGQHEMAALLQEEFASATMLAADTRAVFCSFFQRTLEVEALPALA